MTKPKTPEQLAESKVRANHKRRIQRLWSGDLTLEEICDEIGMTRDEFLAEASAIGLENRPEPDVYVPTPEEVRMAAAEIRRKWSPEVLESRRVGHRYGMIE
jgi:intergrase/recombinase